MSDESNALPTSRIARWIAIGVLIVLAVALYFRDGRRLAPLTTPVAGHVAPPASPAPPAAAPTR